MEAKVLHNLHQQGKRVKIWIGAGRLRKSGSSAFGNQPEMMSSFGMEDFAKKYGTLQPSQFVDIISLVGDKSDNIPGVDGIGNVHAVQLITKFGTLENLLQCIEQVEEERIKKALISNAEQAILSKNLAILRSDLPFYMVPFTTEDLTFIKPEDNGEKFTSLLTAISAYAEGFSADSIIRRAFYLWKKLGNH
ncbi:hypothetical protein BUALT_Bualt09G0006400 [Buddleja alternifolia]|uniref:5'-3' exonuclease domain-containing protein n=1 Tax=Buddleja alternifolia TaxID=168488 RepID=A0AAV6X627_9LAMI|nr:hypothetical protein BUALT_Bualt09G0006400 [Buddleja alternifolia]